MGDRAHNRRRSDHNVGNAIDITHDPEHGCDAGKLAEEWRRQMASFPGGRLSYIIHNRLIAVPTFGWRWRTYKGPNPHLNHVHLSIKVGARDELRRWSF
jgi:hypothetical protein